MDKLEIFKGKIIKEIKYYDSGDTESILIEFEDSTSTIISMERCYAPMLTMLYYKKNHDLSMSTEDQRQMFILPT